MISGKKDVHKLGLSNNPTTSIPMKNRKQATNGHISSSLTSSLGSSSSVVSKLVNLIKPQIPHLQIRITLASWGSVGMRGDKEKKICKRDPVSVHSISTHTPTLSTDYLRTGAKG